MLALTRGCARLDAALRSGTWESQWAIDAPPPAADLAGKTLGILGCGRSGRAVAHRARAFDMEVCAIRREIQRPAGDAVVLLGGLEALNEGLRASAPRKRVCYA